MLNLPNSLSLQLDPQTQAILEMKRRAASKELQRRKLIHFTTAFTNDYSAGWVHNEVAEHLEAFMEAVERKLSPRLMVFLPPRTGKTQLVSRCFPAFLLGHHPQWEIIAATYGQELADDIGRYVRSILNDPIYHSLFPDTKVQTGSNAADRLDTTSRGGYRAVGRGGSLTGRGANVLLIDDPIKDDSEAGSSTIQDQLRSWYNTSARSRLAPGGGVIIVQTLWSLNDLPLGLLEAAEKDKNADQWCVYKYPAIAVVDEKNRKKGEALHPERFPVHELEKTRASFYSMGLSRWWNSLYQQNPVDEEGNFFKNEWVRYYDALPSGELNWYIGVDYAVSKSTTADHTAIVRFAVDKDHNIYIDPAIFHERCSSLDAIDAVLQRAKEKNVFSIGSEKGVIENALGPLWEQRCKETKQWPFVHKLARTQGKHIYAATLQGRMQQGKVFFPKTRFVDEILVPELMAFRADADNKSDNLVDALTNGLMMLGDLLPARQSSKDNRLSDIVPGSWEDLQGRKHVDVKSLAPKRQVSLHAWRKKDKKVLRPW
jgi:hypothetical protein